tara:strand:- start:1384 stop:2649 length:1266 start_codon:yes stop_codon:yes gene_type:complete
MKLIFFLLGFSCYAKDIILIPKQGKSSETAIDNGALFYQSVQNANPGDRILLNANDDMYFIPYDILYNLYNITIEFNGNIFLHDNISAWTYYPDTQSYLNAIDIQDSKNITITQTNEDGVIDGQGYTWWKAFFHGEISRQRPTILNLENCININIINLTLLNGPRFHIYGENILSMLVQYITIWVEPHDMFPFNTDGIDVSGKNIDIRDSMISNYDDAICIKPADYDTPSLDGINMSCTENIVVDNIYVYKGVGLSVGSVASNKQHCIRNVVFQNIVTDLPIKFIYIKTGSQHDATNVQGYIENITYRNMTANHALLWPIYIGPQQQKEPDGTGDGLWPSVNPYVEIKDILLENIHIHLHSHFTAYGVLRCGIENPCTNIHFKDVKIKGKHKMICSNKGTIVGTYDNKTKPSMDTCGLTLV